MHPLDDVIDDLRCSKMIRSYGQVGTCVARASLLVKLSNVVERWMRSKQRPHAATVGEAPGNHFDRHLNENPIRVLLQEFERWRKGRRAAAECENGWTIFDGACDHIVLVLTKRPFAVGVKDVGNRSMLARDDFIDVNEAQFQLSCETFADRGLTRGHEAHEREVIAHGATAKRPSADGAYRKIRRLHASTV